MNESGAIIKYEYKTAKGVINMFGNEYSRRGFRISIYKYIEFKSGNEIVEDLVFVKHIKSGFR